MVLKSLKKQAPLHVSLNTVFTGKVGVILWRGGGQDPLAPAPKSATESKLKNAVLTHGMILGRPSKKKINKNK